MRGRAKRVRWIEEIEAEKVRTAIFDLATERAVSGLILARVAVTVACPAAVLPVRNLAPLDRLERTRSRTERSAPALQTVGQSPRAGDDHAHARLPTSAFVEAKIFSPSLTLS